MKKLLSVALAIAMILGCLSVMASAVTSNGVIEITVTPKASSYAKGDTVIFEVFYEESAETEGLGTPTSIAFGYDSSVFEPVEDLSSPKNLAEGATSFIWTGYAIEDNIVPPVSSAVVKSGASAADAAKGWDSYIMFKVGGNDFDDYKTKTASFAFQLKVRADANDAGSYTVGISDYALNREDVNINDPYGGIYGTDTGAFGFSNPKMFSTVDGTVVVPAAATSILKYSKSQIRFKGITATSGPSTYQGTFDVRTVAKISQADFLATFTSEENAKAKITDFGFVYAAKSKVASFNADTAKAVAEGTPATGYVKAPVTYMQHTADGADYIFTCLITNIPDAAKTDGVNCLAYVCFDGNYIYFDAAESVDYSTLYALMPTA